MDVTTYAHYEKGRRTPNADKLRMLSLYYGLTDELFDVHKGETENDINHSVELTKHYVDSLMKNLNISENDAINILDIPDDVKKRMLIYYMALYNSKRESQKENNNSKKKKI